MRGNKDPALVIHGAALARLSWTTTRSGGKLSMVMYDTRHTMILARVVGSWSHGFAGINESLLFFI